MKIFSCNACNRVVHTTDANLLCPALQALQPPIRLHAPVAEFQG